ncbi:hypothetical protein MASR2M66_15460 [Chloroflexota bacterium]
MINLRCLYCQTPFTVGRAEMLTALITMDEKNQSHYDGHCPRCRRANSISRQRMELFFPNWREAAKNLPEVPADDVPSSTSLKTEPLSKSVKGAAGKTTAKKTVAAKKAPAAKSAPAKKPAAAKKPATKPGGKTKKK